MLGWFSFAHALASRKKRARRSSETSTSSEITLSATSRSRIGSWALKIMPMPPRPIGSTMRYLPIVSGWSCAGPRPPTLTARPGSGEPVPERLDDRAGLDEGVADHGDDLVGGAALAVDAAGLDLHVDDLAGDRLDLA